jgi:hypothetical protein
MSILNITKEGVKMTEHEKYLENAGHQIAEVLKLKTNKDGLYITAWGTKTGMGISATIQRLSEMIDKKERV